MKGKNDGGGFMAKHEKSLNGKWKIPSFAKGKKKIVLYDM